MSEPTGLPPVIEDPYSVPIDEVNPIDGRLFQMNVHEAHFKRLREEDPVHLNGSTQTRSAARNRERCCGASQPRQDGSNHQGAGL